MDKDNLSELVAQIADELANTALTNAMAAIPDDLLKEQYREELHKFLRGGVDVVLRGKDYRAYMQHGVYVLGEKIAEDYTQAALTKISEKLPPGNGREALQRNIKELSREGLNALIYSGDWSALETKLTESISDTARNYVTDVGQYLACKSVQIIADEFKDRGRGKGNTVKNRQINALSKALQDNLTENISIGVAKIWQGQNFDAVCEEIIITTGKETATKFISENSGKYIGKFGDSVYHQMKFSGKGSRFANHQLKNAQGSFEQAATQHLGQNAFAVINGEKSISEAVKDTAVGTVKDGAKNYVKGYGAELAEQGVKTLITYTEKEVKNKLARNVLVGGLNKIANADILMRGAGAIIDVGHSIKRLMNGEITKTEFLYEIGEKAAGYCSASVFGFIGMSMGGPLGAAVGEVVCSLVGYFANKILYRAVLPAMEEARQARQRYEVYHEFCEYSIKQMEKQRQEFIKVTTRLFAHRQAVIDDTFRRYDAALEHNNYEEINSALGALVEEFGMDWKYQTMDDVKRNLNDENFVLEL